MTPEEIAERVENRLRYKAVPSGVVGDSVIAAHNRREIAEAIAAERERCFEAAVVAYTAQDRKPHESDVTAFVEIMGEALGKC